MFNLGKRWELMMVYGCVIIFSLSGFAVAEPLHEAAKEGDLAKVKTLIAEGSDVNVRTGTGITPLHWAAQGRAKVRRGTLFSSGKTLYNRPKVSPFHTNRPFTSDSSIL